MRIMPYNRVVRDLGGLSDVEFLARIQERFDLEQAPVSPYAPEAPHQFGMYFRDKWYKLTAKREYVPEQDPVNSLDAAILQNNLLAPALGINDPRTDKRIEFIGGIRGLGELERRVKEDMQIAFSLFPTSIADVMRVADAGLVMPPNQPGLSQNC